MTKRGQAGAMVLSARFLAWAKSNGWTAILEDIETARVDYKAAGADTSRYENLTDEELTERRAKAITRVNRLTAEADRREPVIDEIPEPASSG